MSTPFNLMEVTEDIIHLHEHDTHNFSIKILSHTPEKT